MYILSLAIYTTDFLYGFSSDYVGTVDGVNVSAIIWKDKKFVTIHAKGHIPISTLKRFGKDQKLV